MKKLILMSLSVVFFLTSCYDDYKTDYEYTASYFAYQYPVRTLTVDRDAENLTFKVGAVMGGKYSYDGSNESVTFSIEDTLINNNQAYLDAGIKVMPSDWYTLSDDSKIEMNGSNMGQVTVTVDQAKLIANADASLNTYGIPFVMTETSCDSILDGKNYSIVVVKYKNEYAGRYYIKGQDDALAPDGSVASSEIYTNPALVLNKYVYLNTTDQDKVEIARIGSNEDARKYVYNMQISPADGSAVLSNGAGGKVSSLVGASVYDQVDKTFISKYNYTMAGVEHAVTDTLIFYNEEMALEEWR